jgi:hypothetical protein
MTIQTVVSRIESNTGYMDLHKANMVCCPLMKRKSKHCWLKIPPISAKRPISSHLHSLNTTKETTTYDAGNQDSGFNTGTHMGRG